MSWVEAALHAFTVRFALKIPAFNQFVDKTGNLR